MPNFEQPTPSSPEKSSEEEKNKEQEKIKPEDAKNFNELYEAVGNISDEIENKMIKETLKEAQGNIKSTKEAIERLKEKGMDVKKMAESNNPVIVGLLEGIPSGALRKKAAEIILKEE